MSHTVVTRGHNFIMPDRLAQAKEFARLHAERVAAASVYAQDAASAAAAASDAIKPSNIVSKVTGGRFGEGKTRTAIKHSFRESPRAGRRSIHANSFSKSPATQRSQIPAFGRVGDYYGGSGLPPLSESGEPGESAVTSAPGPSPRKRRPLPILRGELEKKTSGGLARWKSGYFFEMKGAFLQYSKKQGGEILGGVDLRGAETTVELIEDTELDKSIKFYCIKVAGMSRASHEVGTRKTMLLRRTRNFTTRPTIHEWYDGLVELRAALHEREIAAAEQEEEKKKLEKAGAAIHAVADANVEKESSSAIADANAEPMAARTPSPKNKLRAKHIENRETFTVPIGPGKLGIAVTLDPSTCMAVVQNNAAPDGQVDIGAPGRVKAGDRLDAMNHQKFCLLTSLDQDGNGRIDASELVSALETSGLRESWITRVGVDVAAHQTNEEMADAIIAEFDAKGDGSLDGDETSAFFQFMLEAHLAQIQASPRPMTLTFSRPKPADAPLVRETLAVIDVPTPAPPLTEPEITFGLELDAIQKSQSGSPSPSSPAKAKIRPTPVAPPPIPPPTPPPPKPTTNSPQKLRQQAAELLPHLTSLRREMSTTPVDHVPSASHDAFIRTDEREEQEQEQEDPQSEVNEDGSTAAQRMRSSSREAMTMRQQDISPRSEATSLLPGYRPAGDMSALPATPAPFLTADETMAFIPAAASTFVKERGPSTVTTAYTTPPTLLISAPATAVVVSSFAVQSIVSVENNAMEAMQRAADAESRECEVATRQRVQLQAEVTHAADHVAWQHLRIDALREEVSGLELKESVWGAQTNRFVLAADEHRQRIASYEAGVVTCARGEAMMVTQIKRLVASEAVAVRAIGTARAQVTAMQQKLTRAENISADEYCYGADVAALDAESEAMTRDAAASEVRRAACEIRLKRALEQLSSEQSRLDADRVEADALEVAIAEAEDENSAIRRKLGGIEAAVESESAGKRGFTFLRQLTEYESSVQAALEQDIVRLGSIHDETVASNHAQSAAIAGRAHESTEAQAELTKAREAVEYTDAAADMHGAARDTDRSATEGLHASIGRLSDRLGVAVGEVRTVGVNSLFSPPPHH